MIDEFVNLKIDKVLEEDININKNTNLVLDITKYLNLNININVSKGVKSTINLITKHNTRYNLNLNLEDDSSLKVFIALFGRKNNNEIKANLIGKNSNVNISLITVSNKTSSTYYTVINHLNDNTNSIVNNNAILLNKSDVLMDIKSNIQNGSIISNSKQSIEGILLDNTSKLEMIPTLFIDENNIFASHSSKISKINENDLYYIMSKGISLEDANIMYANNFLMKFVPEEYKETVEKLIERTI